MKHLDSLHSAGTAFIESENSERIRKATETSDSPEALLREKATSAVFKEQNIPVAAPFNEGIPVAAPSESSVIEVERLERDETHRSDEESQHTSTVFDNDIRTTEDSRKKRVASKTAEDRTGKR